MSTRIEKIQIRHRRIRKKVQGTAERPRLSVHFSGRNISVQVIDDLAGHTLAAASTLEPEFRSFPKRGANIPTAERIGKIIADRSLAKNIRKVVFDRGGFLYHGKVKALADAARAAGLEF
ncbi:MAG: 50S ribosomal protein L18 [Chthoniobacterales bacterium]|nr:50S ribosomal protein L18 [Chthoniobacterales bacterium]MCX7712575.1 50S ribosomal protein L18 [Chthoniobacterales bacterium]